ncbi:phage terminase small subunit [Oceanobacillus sp. FSL K6-0251]|uniref:phage terminase small subunit n=1 Tax=Oceanobacillus sp. FSL K6-0251 TaxID=2921602 RepID=UPI0030F6ED33
MAEKHKLAEKDYIKGMKYKEIAEKHGVSLNTVKSWKQRHGWIRNKGAPEKESVHTKKRGAPKGSKNALGNKGGAAPKGNSNAVTHGLFAKYLPEETLEIVNSMDSISPIEILWMNIKMQFASIMRAQQIMFVQDRYDTTEEVKKTASGDGFESTEYEIQFAWDKQANFLKSQSRAMGELRSMLKQFIEMAHADDYRLLEVEKMQVAIDKAKAETAKIKGEDGTEYEDDGFMDAIKSTTSIWDDDDE